MGFVEEARVIQTDSGGRKIRHAGQKGRICWKRRKQWIERGV